MRKIPQIFPNAANRGRRLGHDESPAYVFMTALGYVALRLLGLGADEEMPRRALQWLQQQGGVLAIPSWGKFWLALLGLYRWEGVNPILPELWLLPRWLPFAPPVRP